ncbi:Uncharacterised protein [Mycobacteroides abscessus subsp. abscessus]|nr:Uncharacterised protein [Mycobacteroides abscessus subsp. abscessus]SHT64460.1 Uncharacterised protein [Mycobacteroides abscessus subsp. abscessus]SHW11271.1 Uncharacterised protein [Mycobacteroides abscessus subsp. abscessus]SIH77440.1 Uncharacterised protein [Mycobacteroides abscessus subsp. abscessus]SIH84858.1 Uncharacterised protein [Mycobacteroides abscessus subsp. abscessus]
MGHGAGPSRPGEVSQAGGRDEVDGSMSRRPPTALKSGLALDVAQRKALMSQRFLYAGGNVFTEVGYRGIRRGCQPQRHHARTHTGHQQRLRAHPPTHREVEHHLCAPNFTMHQQGTCRGDHRRAPNPQRVRQLTGLGNNGRIQLNWRRWLVLSESSRSGRRRPIPKFIVERATAGPVGRIVKVVLGALIVRLRFDEASQRSENRCGNRRIRSDRGVNSGDSMTQEAHANTVGHDVVTAHEEIEVVGPYLHQREPEQRSVQRHRRLLDRSRNPIGVTDRIRRTR